MWTIKTTNYVIKMYFFNCELEISESKSNFFENYSCKILEVSKTTLEL